MAAVHLGLLMPLAFTGTRHSGLAHADASPERLLFAGVFAYKAYTARAFTHNAGSLLGLAVRPCELAWRWRLQRAQLALTLFLPMHSWEAWSRSYGSSRSSLRRRLTETQALGRRCAVSLCHFAALCGTQPASCSLRSRNAHALGRHASLVDS